MNTSRFFVSASLAFVFAVAAQAQPAPAASSPSNAAAASTSAGSAMADGEVRRVDKEAGKITLRHGPLPNLDMRAMTMVFRVADPKMLDSVKEGDKVRFVADKVNGAFTVMQMEAAK